MPFAAFEILRRNSRERQAVPPGVRRGVACGSLVSLSDMHYGSGFCRCGGEVPIDREAEPLHEVSMEALGG